MGTSIAKGIYWVGAIDWDIRNFHGYQTQGGTTYNSYLIIDEKVVLVDTVKPDKQQDLLDSISRIIDPSKIDYILSNHVEMDHSGAISHVLEKVPDAVVITSKKGEKGLRNHFKKDWNFKVVASGDSIKIGSKTLQFVATPMVHWPDSMMTYIPEDNLLFSNDAFGLHLATPERLDEEIGWSRARMEAAKYYANIILPFGKPVKKALASLGSFKIDTICPSHGIIWKKHVPDILKEYHKWSDQQKSKKAVIIYDSMWESTEQIAKYLAYGLQDVGIIAVKRGLKANHISDVMTDVLDSGLILLGSPTLNNGILPTLGSFTTYLKGLAPANKTGYAFGSYGWGGQSVTILEDLMTQLEWDIPISGQKVEYVPGTDEKIHLREIGSKLGELFLNSFK
ncbi:MAG: FprA family A-type flavoprotein [Deltaproteobacteria bacterium]|jgi:flavorubredoxin|nr:FprA family A-type flavoprotein [Deltaproteobacteria bacterium]MBT4527646.1 FprA family A-type flavoprotein [Deltaproteobacteria bacterium]